MTKSEAKRIENLIRWYFDMLESKINLFIQHQNAVNDSAWDAISRNPEMALAYANRYWKEKNKTENKAKEQKKKEN